MRLDCEAAREMLDASALGALDEEDRRNLDAHLSTCDACRALGDEAAATASALALAVPMHSSSAALKSRVMASARVLSDIRRPGVSRWWRTIAGAAAVVAIGAFSWATVMQFRASDLEDDRSALAEAATAQSGELQTARAQVAAASTESDLANQTLQTQNQVLDVVLRPGLEWTQLSGTAAAPSARGMCAWSRTEALGAFLADSLPTPSRGSHYVFWLVYENAWINGGAFDVDEEGRGRLVVKKVWGQEDIGRFIKYAVTLETSGEPAAPPSGELVLSSATP